MTAIERRLARAEEVARSREARINEVLVHVGERLLQTGGASMRAVLERLVRTTTRAEARAVMQETLPLLDQGREWDGWRLFVAEVNREIN